MLGALLWEDELRTVIDMGEGVVARKEGPLWRYSKRLLLEL